LFIVNLIDNVCPVLELLVQIELYNCFYCAIYNITQACMFSYDSSFAITIGDRNDWIILQLLLGAVVYVMLRKMPNFFATWTKRARSTSFASCRSWINFNVEHLLKENEKLCWGCGVVKGLERRKIGGKAKCESEEKRHYEQEEEKEEEKRRHFEEQQAADIVKYEEHLKREAIPDWRVTEVEKV